MTNGEIILNIYSMKKSTKTISISGKDLVIRPMDEVWEYEAALELQRQTWGDERGELIYRTHMLISQKVGGIAAGAFYGDTLAGFVFGLTGLRDGALAHWSHMLAVAETWQGKGLGGCLKQYQRDLLLENDVQYMYWTYDPLVARNAHLNLNKLGAVVQSYEQDMYGYDPNGILSAGIGTDRFIIRWDLKKNPENIDSSPDIEDLLAIPMINTDAGPGRNPRLKDCELFDRPIFGVEVPEDILKIQNTDMDLAISWRENTKRIFIHYLDSGYRINAFHRLPDSDRYFYILRKD